MQEKRGFFHNHPFTLHILDIPMHTKNMVVLVLPWGGVHSQTVSLSAAIKGLRDWCILGVTLAQLVKASVGQADV